MIKVKLNVMGPLFNEINYWNIEAIKLPQALGSIQNLKKVIVAVIDSGCDLNHPFIRYTGRGINISNGEDGEPIAGENSAHGTCCAGIISTIAPNCEILPIAIDWYNYNEISTAIRYAADYGAKVINMSFTYEGNNIEIIDEAIKYAESKGCVLCACTGNDGLRYKVAYPAQNPNVIACGAIDRDGKRKTYNSSDGELWESNYCGNSSYMRNKGVSVVAPGVHIFTTDILGVKGYNNSKQSKFWKGVVYSTAGDADGKLFYHFSGTSSSTPHVSALAALLLGINDHLTPAQVRKIIESTAAKPGDSTDYKYTIRDDYPNGRWNEEMGYGLINVFEAVNKVTRIKYTSAFKKILKIVKI